MEYTGFIWLESFVGYFVVVGGFWLLWRTIGVECLSEIRHLNNGKEYNISSPHVHSRVFEIAFKVIGWVLVALLLAHPALISKPRFMTPLAVVHPDRTLERLPFGAIDFLVDGNIVKLRPEFSCSLHSIIRRNTDGVQFELKPYFQGGLWFHVNDFEKFSQSYEVDYIAFCNEITTLYEETVLQNMELLPHTLPLTDEEYAEFEKRQDILFDRLRDKIVNWIGDRGVVLKSKTHV